MEFAVPLLTALMTQAAEVATITVSFGDALAGGAVGGGLPVAAILGWLGIKKMRGKNGTSDPSMKIVTLLSEISADLKAERELRQQQFELQKRQLDAMITLETSGAKVEDRLELVREELRDVHDAVRDNRRN